MARQHIFYRKVYSQLLPFINITVTIIYQLIFFFFFMKLSRHCGLLGSKLLNYTWTALVINFVLYIIVYSFFSLSMYIHICVYIIVGQL